MRAAIQDPLPAQASIHSVPFFAQKAYQCGPAAMAMVLAWSGLPISPDDLTPIVYTPERKGSFQANLIGAARRHGRLAYPITGVDCLIREIAAGHPVIVLQNLGLRWLPRWHYAVAIGYDQQAEQIILHTGLVENRRVGFATFQRTWLRANQWGLVVLPPHGLPACAGEEPYLKAALGLQQAGHPAAAASAFQTAAQHWPQSFAAHMALGNIRYQQGDPETAVRAFRQATRIDPDSGSAHNNLAHVLMELGRLDEAERQALRAVELGGPHNDLFSRTLQEIHRRRQ
jgi:tetratricopeptide (TPR) repeat protein